MASLAGVRDREGDRVCEMQQAFSWMLGGGSFGLDDIVRPAACGADVIEFTSMTEEGRRG